ncbi:MAG: CPBP family intramembrane metalloprotease [Clostridia bacterium]|nr:CPBP family intramembrane metalloprotease [Clostridia bacterium]
MNFFNTPFELVEEARKTGRGHNIFLEILKFIGVGIAAVVAMGSISFLIGVVNSLLGIQPDLMAGTVIALLLQAVVIAVSILYCTLLEKRSAATMGFTKEGAAASYLKGLAIGFIMFAAVVGIGLLLGGFKYAGVSDDISPLSLILLFLGFMVQGMSEEVMCRGYFLISMSRKGSVLWATIINSLVFAVLHIFNGGFNILPCINIFIVGVFFSMYMLVTGDIWGVGAIHSIWNFVQGCFFGFSVSGMPLLPTVFKFEVTENALIGGGAFGPEGGLAVTAVCVLSIVLLMLWKSKKVQTDI